MAVNLKIRVDEKKLDDQIFRLKKVYSEETIEKSSKAILPFQQRALAYLKLLFPDSRKGSHSISDVAEFGKHLVEGWKATPILQATTIGFIIENVLGNRDRHASRILDALDLGSGVNRLLPSLEDRVILLFPGNRGSGGFRTLARKMWVRPARPGYHYKDATYAYIANTLLPQMGAKIRKVATDVING